MRKTLPIVLFTIATLFQFPAHAQIADPSDYLSDIKNELLKEWPANKTINLVFHGHSVPAGYFKTPVVNTFGSYPFLLLKELKEHYPYAVINIINTSVGGENSESGASRFASEVMIHKPDVLFIDYALNDRTIGMEKSKMSWEKMIRKALKKNIKIILLSPSPDQNVNILEPETDLAKFSMQISMLAGKYGLGYVDSYGEFRNVVAMGGQLPEYMSQVNHPNEKGNLLIAKDIMKYFVSNPAK